MPRKPKTVGQLLIEQLGFGRAVAVGAFIAMWSMYRAVYERDPGSIEELAEELGRSRSQVFRWQQDFRAVFPQWRTPGELLDAVDVERVVTPRGAMRLRAT